VKWPFTPESKSGGWQVQASDSFTGMYWIEEAGEEQEAAMGGSNRQAKLSEVHDSNNANLIAAAPRMYRALKGLLAAGYTPDPTHDSGLLEAEKVIDWIDESLRV
jgi:hypothetical protein